MQTRIEIENAWQRESERAISNIRKSQLGKSLCCFIESTKSVDLNNGWNSKVWNSAGLPLLMSDFFQDVESTEDWYDMTYLCRALSLNMLLDDNEIE